MALQASGRQRNITEIGEIKYSLIWTDVGIRGGVVFERTKI
jgi:hypothetical protein